MNKTFWKAPQKKRQKLDPWEGAQVCKEWEMGAVRTLRIEGKVCKKEAASILFWLKGGEHKGIFLC